MTTATERRQHPRTAVRLPATIERIGGRPLVGDASTVDLSEGGARLLGPAGFAVGDVVRVVIASADGDVSADHQALVVGHQASTGGQATLHVAFRSSEPVATTNLRRLLDRD